MNVLDQNHKKPFIFALVVHVVILFFLIFQFSTNSSFTVAKTNTQNFNIINARAVDAKQLQTQPKKPNKPQPETKPMQVQQEQQEIKQQPDQSAQIAFAKKQQQQAQIAKQLAAEKIQQAKIQKEKKLAQQKQQKINELKKITQQKIQQDLAAEQTKEIAKEAAKETENQEAAAQASIDQGILDKYKGLIIQAISQQWIVPDTQKKDEEAKLLVHLAPGGMVVSVEIAKSSGDPVLDRSAQTAVMKASPLPVPKDPAQFESFRVISLTVRPDGVS